MFTPELSRYIKSIEYASLTSLLQDFRRQLEYEYGGPIHEIGGVNAAELISNLCLFVGLSDQNRRKVLGTFAAAALDTRETTQGRATIWH